ncbi:MAG: tail fiber domain-containing protein [Candidatus Fimenecus sp.]
MQYTNAAYKQAVQKLPQNYRMEIEVIFDAETEDLLYPLLCETGENLEPEKGEALEYAEPAERIVIPPDDIFEAGFSEAVFLSTFCVGSSVAADFWVRIFNKDGKYKNDALAKAEIRPRVTLFDETGAVTDTVPVGVFFVNQITVQNSDLRLECIDKMRYLEKPYIAKHGKFQLYQIMQNIAWSVRASLVTTSAEINTLSRIVDDSIFDGYTRRQVVELIAEACGSFAVFNAEGNLELRWFKSVPVELRGDWAKRALELNGNAFSLDGNVVQVTGVRIVNEDTELAEVGTDEYLLTINENPITATDAEVFAERILERLSSTKYIPCKWQRIGGDPSLQVGDIVTVIDNKETYNESDYDRYDKYPLYMTSRSWTYNCGGFSDTYCAAGNAERDLNTDRGMTQSKRISRLAKRITEADNALSELTDRETALLLFNEQMFNSMGLYKTVKDSENGGVIVYYHDKTELENSGTIYMFGASGFAWTTDGWNDGEPLWNYGFTGAGDAILNTIHAYMISADLIKTGLLQSQNGASWINMDDGTFCFRAVKDAYMDVDTGEMDYTYDEKMSLDETGELGVYGTLRSNQFPDYSAGIGPSTDDDTEDLSGIPIFRVTDACYKNGDLFQVVDVGMGTDERLELRFPFLTPGDYPKNTIVINCTRDAIALENTEQYGRAMLSGLDAWIGTYRDNINIATAASHRHCWFNYFMPLYGYAPTAYDFGNGDGGHAEVYAAKFNATSNPQEKENIKEVKDINAIQKIKTLRFYSYDYKNDAEQLRNISAKVKTASQNADLQSNEKIHEELGIMADEAPKEIQSSDGKAIDLYAYIGLTAKAVQELSAKIEQLEKRIAELEAENKELKQ